MMSPARNPALSAGEPRSTSTAIGSPVETSIFIAMPTPPVNSLFIFASEFAAANEIGVCTFDPTAGPLAMALPDANTPSEAVFALQTKNTTATTIAMMPNTRNRRFMGRIVPENTSRRNTPILGPLFVRSVSQVLEPAQLQSKLSGCFVDEVVWSVPC
jgi:hypothetical protein